MSKILAPISFLMFFNASCNSSESIIVYDLVRTITSSLTRKWGLDEGGGRCVLGGPFFSMAEIGKNWQNLANNKTTMHVELDIV